MFRKEVIFVVDISGSMRGRSLESTKKALNTALSKLSPEDSFNIIAFSDETFLFCTSMVLASEESIEKASEWMCKEHSEGNGTNMLIPLQKVLTHFLYFLLNFPRFLYLFKRKENDFIFVLVPKKIV